MSETKDGAQIADSMAWEIKGPDRHEWGPDEERPSAASEPGLALHEIKDEGTENEIKGPGHQWETNDEGEYVNR